MAERIYGHHRYVLYVRESGRAEFAQVLMDVLPGLRRENLRERAVEWRAEALRAMEILAPFMGA